NDRACEMHGYTRPEFLRLSVSDFLMSEAHPRMDEIGRCLRETGKYEGQQMHRRKDGSVFPCAINLRTVAVGGRDLVICVYRDLTEQERAAKELEEAKAFLEHVQENASDGLALLDENGVYVAVNQKVLEWGRHRREDIIGTPWMTGHDPEKLEAYKQAWEKLMQGGRVSMRTSIDPPGGPQVIVDVSSAMIRRGERKFVFAIIRDVTDQVKSE